MSTKSLPTAPPEKLRTIARNLLTKTKAGQANWVRTQARGDSTETAYTLILPESRVVVVFGVPRADVDYVSLRFQNAKGEPTDSWTVSEPDYDPDVQNLEEVDPDGDWRLLKELFVEVHRRVTGWDKVLSDVEKALAGSGPIGAPPPK